MEQNVPARIVKTDDGGQNSPRLQSLKAAGPGNDRALLAWVHRFGTRKVSIGLPPFNGHRQLKSKVLREESRPVREYLLSH